MYSKHEGIMKAELSLIGNIINPQHITNLLLVDDLPDYDHSISPQAWTWSTKPVQCYMTDTPLKILAGKFYSKINVIRELCTELSLDAHIKIFVRMLEGEEYDDPMLGFDSTDIVFANDINADIEIIIENWPEIVDDDAFWDDLLRKKHNK